jgi:hypothetical protein
LRPLRALAEREESADDRALLADGLGHPLPADDANAPLARDVAAALTEAGFTLHNCAPHHPQYWLGGVCVLPIPARHNPDSQSGIAVSWTTHNLLMLDWDRGHEQRGTQQAMNSALASVLKALGYRVQPFGPGGASLVTGSRSVRPQAARRTRTSRGRTRPLVWAGPPDQIAPGLTVHTGLSVNGAGGWSTATGVCTTGEYPEEDINVAAVAAYRTSVDTGRPLSERRLAAMFSKTSRRWTRSRMAEARQAGLLATADEGLVSGGLGGKAVATGAVSVM